jgi:hypothetical protein
MTNNPKFHLQPQPSNELTVLHELGLSTGPRRADAIRAIGLLSGTGCSLTEAAQIYLSHYSANYHPEMTFDQASKLVLERARGAGRSPATIRWMQSSYSKITKGFGHVPCSSITKSDVERYLHSLRGRDGSSGAASASFKNAILNAIKAAMRAAGVCSPLPYSCAYKRPDSRRLKAVEGTRQNTQGTKEFAT